MRLYFDTETTGIPNKYKPWTDPCQPAIVSIAWIFVGGNDDWTTIDERHHLIKPDGWTIDEEGPAFAAHRIPQSRCEEEGRPIADILDLFHTDLSAAKEIIAYNIQFDVDLLTIACERSSRQWFNLPPRLDILPLAQIACQMPPTDRMRAAGRNGFKPPKLSEALKILCGEEFPDAHDALADVKASIKIHKKLEEFRNGKANTHT